MIQRLSKAKQARKVKQSVKRFGNLRGVPGETRTHDPLLRRQLLYPTELQGRTTIQIQHYDESTVKMRVGSVMPNETNLD